MTEESIGGMFAGGILPGDSSWCPIHHLHRYSVVFPARVGTSPTEGRKGLWKEKVASLKAVILPIIIIFLVLGSIYTGVCTATEAAALGCLGAISTIVYRKLSWTLVRQPCFRARFPYCNDQVLN